MGIMNAIFGNVSEMDGNELQKEYAPLLCGDERIEKAFKLIRDKWVFTNKSIDRAGHSRRNGQEARIFLHPV